jgi:hypothetical protein
MAQASHFIKKNSKLHAEAQRQFSNLMRDKKLDAQGIYCGACNDAAHAAPRARSAMRRAMDMAHADEFAARSLQLKPKNPILPGFKYDDYLQVKSMAAAGFKHPTVTLRLPNRGHMDMETYVEQTCNMGQAFVRALTNRSKHVDPRMAVRYSKTERPMDAISRYTGAVDFMESPDVQRCLASLSESAPKGLKSSLRNQAQSTPYRTDIHMSKDQAVQIQIANDRTGTLNKSLSCTESKPIEVHIADGFDLAGRTKAALDATAKAGLDKHLSPKMLRTNAFSKKLSTQGLSRYEEATQYLLTPTINFDLKQIASSGAGVEFKILRDGTARVIQRNKQGEIVSNHTFKGNTVQAGIDDAIDHATDLLLDPELPQLRQTRQFVLNPFHEVKRNAQYNVDRLTEGKGFQLKAKSQTKASPDMDEEPRVSWKSSWTAKWKKPGQKLQADRQDTWSPSPPLQDIPRDSNGPIGVAV